MGRKKKKASIVYPSARVQHLVIFLYNEAGASVMTKEKIDSVLQAHVGGYETYSYILHDQDEYDTQTVYEQNLKNQKTYLDRYQTIAELSGMQKDETSKTGYIFSEEVDKKAKEYADKCFPAIEAKTKKHPHWHIILTFAANRKIDEIARWFGIEPNWVEAKTGRGAAESAWAYLVHANDKNKYQYSPADVISSFDYQTSLKEQIEKAVRHEKYGISANELNDILDKITHGELSIKEAQELVSVPVYLRNKRLFEEARKEYVQNYAEMPWFREVFYIDSEGLDNDHGRGGLGKTACSKALAKQLAREFGADPSKHIDDLREFIFTAGDKSVFLQSYMGQPVLLVDEINALDLKRALGGVNAVKSLLDPFPERGEINKKHGSVVCTAKYIILNGIQSFEAFKNDLAESDFVNGTKEKSEKNAREQFDRRFWGHIHIIDASKIEFWINRGLFENTTEREVMEMVCRVRANFKAINSNTAGEAKAQIEEKVLRPLLSEVEKSQDTHAKKSKIQNPEELTSELLSMGEIIEADYKEISLDESDEDLPY